MNGNSEDNAIKTMDWVEEAGWKQRLQKGVEAELRVWRGLR